MTDHPDHADQTGCDLQADGIVGADRTDRSRTDGTHRTDPPIVCDLSDAPDTPVERLAEYRQLFADALIARERLPDGTSRFRFRADPGVEERVGALAAKEQACCAFFRFTIAAHGDEIWWDATTIDDPLARQVLDELHQLPHTLHGGADALFQRFDALGLGIITDGGDIPHPTREAGSTTTS